MSLNTSVVDELFQQRFEEKLTPGLAYGVVRGSELVHSGAFGATTEGGPAPTAESVFRIASMSKSFTAAAVLLLRDRGLVDLDEAIAQYVPELVDRAGAGGRVRVLQPRLCAARARDRERRRWFVSRGGEPGLRRARAAGAAGDDLLGLLARCGAEPGPRS